MSKTSSEPLSKRFSTDQVWDKDFDKGAIAKCPKARVPASLDGSGRMSIPASARQANAAIKRADISVKSHTRQKTGQVAFGISLFNSFVENFVGTFVEKIFDRPSLGQRFGQRCDGKKVQTPESQHRWTEATSNTYPAADKAAP
ncbi:MAG: hypothetical protein AB1813_23700 [Verrucomicrobiota bacterium]